MIAMGALKALTAQREFDIGVAALEDFVELTWRE
jgi:hypothetical protein